MQCDCMNGASCHPVSGQCICFPGFHGARCHRGRSDLFSQLKSKNNWRVFAYFILMFSIIHSACERGRYGQGCVHICDCEDAAQCDPVSGRCLCSSGKTGPRCDIGNLSRIFENTQPSNAYCISSVTSLSADVPSLLISNDELCNRDAAMMNALYLLQHTCDDGSHIHNQLVPLIWMEETSISEK